MIWDVNKIQKALPPNHEVLAVAEAMKEGQTYADLDKKSAGQLMRAIEQKHGARTASVRQQPPADGKTLYSVERVPARALRTRKTKETAA